MKHAGKAALDALEPLLVELRALPRLVERGRGCFYRRSSAFLHFHEDPSGTFADVKAAGGEWVRYPVNDRREQARLVDAVMASLADEPAREQEG